MKLITAFTILAISTISTFADINDEVIKLSQEKRTLTMQTSKLFNTHKLYENADYRALQEKAHSASREFNKTRRNHPLLKEHYAKSDAAQKKMIQARINKDKGASSKAMSEYIQSRRDLEKVASGIPELKEAQKKSIAANKAVENKQMELLESTPEGKAHVIKIKTLETKITDLRKQLQPAQP